MVSLFLLLLLILVVFLLASTSCRERGGKVGGVEAVVGPTDEGEVLLLQVLVRDALVHIAAVVRLKEIGGRLVLKMVKVRLGKN